MRVMLVNKFHWNKGGSEKYYFELGQLLKEHGHEVAYFSMNNEKNIKTLSNILEKDFDEKINIITKLLEPMVMIFLGGIVVFMMILIFVPIYECIKYV